jgi:hypothetical protein
MVRYYGFYSNVSRGKRKNQDQDGLIPSILEPGGSSKAHRKNWARLIQKIYEVDPLTCAKLVLAKAGMRGKDENIIFHRRSGNSEEDPQTSGIVGSEGKAASKNQSSIIER